MSKKYLFLCKFARNRSPTAARVAGDLALKKHINTSMNYCAYDIHINSDLNIFKVYLNQFSRFFVMEEYIKQGLIDLGIDKTKITCLNIPDIYKRDEPALTSLLEKILQDVLY
jgi:predicted protein tyrosine phosphatase